MYFEKIFAEKFLAKKISFQLEISVKNFCKILIKDMDGESRCGSMFLNISGRTDIAAYYADWLMQRIREGYVLSRNPLFPDKVYRYRLTPDVVDCLIFCTKNPAPMLPYLSELKARGFGVFFYVTITSYGADLEPRVPEYHQMMKAFQQLSRLLGKKCVCWRYDPVLLTERYTVAHHLRAFAEMTAELAPYTDRCIFSFVQLYQKLAVTFPTLRAVSAADKKVLLTGMSRIASQSGLCLQTCGDGNDYTAYGIQRSGCITAPILEKALGKKLKALRLKPTRPGCGCLPSNDIGAYDTCPHGCRYCYATKDPALALRNYQQRDVQSPLLLGRLQRGDTVIDARQESFVQSVQQMTLEW